MNHINKNLIQYSCPFASKQLIVIAHQRTNQRIVELYLCLARLCVPTVGEHPTDLALTAAV